VKGHADQTSRLTRLQVSRLCPIWSTPVIRERLAVVTARRLVRGWIVEAIACGELVAILAEALASILLALTDGLILRGALANTHVS